jgi:protoporphyrin/coproporphyrin ferrochelatase
MASIKRAVVLMNLGSPDSTDVKDVKRYLDEFLMDEKVIDKPFLQRYLLVKGIITRFRAPKSAEAYKSIWTKEGSPLMVLSYQLQEALQQQIEEPVEVAMRYGNPSPKKAFDDLVAKYPDLEEVILVPLYPHYAMSSYETAVEYAETIHKKNHYKFRLRSIKPFYNVADYIAALAESIKPYLEQEYDHILFSYHSIPERHILKGDTTGNHCLKSNNCCTVDSAAHKYCYRHQCFETTRLAAEKLGLSKDKFSVSFQSRLGRAEWLKPYTALRLAAMPDEGIKKLLVVFPAFVSDCLETLEEIAIEGRHTFLNAGGQEFTSIPCLNVHPQWVKTLAGWIGQVREGKNNMLLETY